MIGRDRELGVLTGIWERVTSEGRAHFVTVFGPAGIGKSRIGLELAQLVADQGAARSGAGRRRTARARRTAPSPSRSSRSPGSSTTTSRTRRARSSQPASRSSTGPAAAEEHAPNLAVLLGLGENGEVPDRETLFFSARVLVESLALDGPTLLLYEDIHWADSSLLDLLETLAARVRDVPVLFVALARPELLTDRPAWGGGLPAYTALPLDPLTETSSRHLASALLSEAGLPEDRAAAITETAEGNPLFIEELSASIAEKSTEGSLPTSIRAIVAARLDSLPPDERSLLVDAVGGRTGLLEGRSHGDLRAGRPLGAARLARGARPHPPRGGVPASGATSSSRSSTA